MSQRRGSVQAGDDEDDIRKVAVQVLDGSLECEIAGSQRGYGVEVEQYVTALPGVEEAEHDSRCNQKVEPVVHDPRRDADPTRVGDGQFPSGTGTPEHTSDQHGGERRAEHDVHGAGVDPGRTLRKEVDRLPKRPEAQNQCSRKPVQENAETIIASVWLPNRRRDLLNRLGSGCLHEVTPQQLYRVLHRMQFR